jgi:hypothetical protein
VDTTVLERWLTLVTLASAALAAMLYLTRQFWRGFKVLEKLADVVNHELSPNSGTSMKDDVAAIAVAVGDLQANVKDLTQSKDMAHQLLQLQLDTVADALGLAQYGDQPTHRGERQRDDLPSNQDRQGPGAQERGHRGGPVRAARPPGHGD